MERKLNILHLASFSGNIGDYANHSGFYKKFHQEFKKYDMNFTQLEIRKFYKNRQEMKFDGSFVKMVNDYDMLVLGGGGFFDLKWDYSNTGTTINFSKKVVDGIKIPVLINAMGYHEYENIKNENVLKFHNFLNIITSRHNWMVTVRNDGSFERMAKRYDNCMTKIKKVPDNGFYFSPKKNNRLCLDANNVTWIGLNISNDLFNKKFNKNITVSMFNELISEFINTTLENNVNYKIILFPHTPQDVNTISQIIEKIADKHLREKITVAPLLIGNESIEYVFDLYRICSCVIAMRFHANVCCIGMGIPTVGLAGHEQILSLYREIGNPGGCVKIDDKGFSKELYLKLGESLKNSSSIKNTYKKLNVELNGMSDIYFPSIKEFISRECL